MTIWGKLIKSRCRCSSSTATDDEIIPVDMGRRLFAAAGPPKDLYIIPGAHHNDTYLVGGRAYFERLKTFIYQAKNSIGRPVAAKDGGHSPPVSSPIPPLQL